MHSNVAHSRLNGSDKGHAAAPLNSFSDSGARHTDCEIAIVGMGCRFPGAANLEAFWNLLSSGVDAIREVPDDRWSAKSFYSPAPVKTGKTYSRWGGFVEGIDEFDPDFFGISRREASSIDPQQRLLLEVTWEAMENAGLTSDWLRGRRVGVFVGASSTDYLQLQSVRDSRTIDAYTNAGNAMSIISNRVSYLLDLRGPSLTIDTACSSSLVAFHYACESLRSGESEAAIVGGVNLLLRAEPFVGFSQAHMLSPDGRCRSFDARGNGYVRAEGAGVVVLKPLKRASSDGDPIHAVVLASGVNQDGRTAGMSLPNEQAQVELLRSVYGVGRIDPHHVSYVEAHGTGTPAGDPIEARAIGRVLGIGRGTGSPLTIGSVKSNIGHLEPASGVAGVIKTVLAMKHAELPATLHYQAPNPQIDFDELRLRVISQHEDWRRESNSPRIAGINSFGFGGTNAHVVLAESMRHEAERRTDLLGEHDHSILFHSADIDRSAPSMHLIPISAKSSASLKRQVESWIGWLDRTDPDAASDLNSIAYSAAARRDHYEHRLCVLASTRERLRSSLSAWQRGETRKEICCNQVAKNRPAKTAFVFNGMGSQWQGMGVELLNHEPVFRVALERVDAVFQRLAGWSIVDRLNDDEFASRMDECQVTQPCIFAIQVGLASLWKSWGVEPGCVVGHSVGEIAAALTAQALSLEDAVQVIFHRSRLQALLRGQGRMLAVALPVEFAGSLIAGYQGDVAIAAVNSPSSLTLSGDSLALEEIRQKLEADQVFCRFLVVDVPYHSDRMDKICEELKDSLSNIQSDLPTIPFYSTVTGDACDKQILDAEYWWQNVRQPVLFASATQKMITDRVDAFIEIGAHPVLASSLADCLADGKKGIVVPSLRRNEPQRAALLASLSRLHVLGHPIDWNRLHHGSNEVVELPGYAWDRESFWFEDRASRRARADGRGETDQVLSSDTFFSLGRQIVSSNADNAWHQSISLDGQHEWVADHQVHGTAIFPAAGFLELGLSVGRQLHPNMPLRIESFSVSSALVLPSEQPVNVQTSVNRNSGDFHVDSASRQNEWTRHCHGRVRADFGSWEDEDRDAIEALRNCTREVAPSALYEAFESIGLNYGPAFRGITSLRTGIDCACASVRVGNGLLESIDQYTTCPVTIDVCMQLMLAALAETQQRDGCGIHANLYLPSKVKLIRIHEPSAFFEACRKPLFVTCRIIESSDQLVRADATISTEEGRLLFTLSDIQARAFPRPKEDASLSGDCFLEQQWLMKSVSESCEHLPPAMEVAQAPATTALSSNDIRVDLGVWWLIGGERKVTEFFAARLVQDGGVSVLITPGQAFRQIGARHYELPLDSLSAVNELQRAAIANGLIPEKIVHLACLTDPVNDVATTEELRSRQVTGVHSVLAFAQSIELADCPTPSRLWVATRRVHATGIPQGEPLCPCAAPIWGLLRVLTNEMPSLRCTAIDLSSEQSDEEIESLFAEICNDSDEREVILRGRSRYVPHLRLADLPVRANRHSPDFKMTLEVPGNLDSIVFLPSKRRSPGEFEVEIEVAAAGMNFKDIAKSLRMLSEQTLSETWSGESLGLECAGRISAVGVGATEFQIGDRVVALAAGCFGSHVITKADFVASIPEELSFEDAAGIPIVFLTAKCALLELARLKAGERVLIHAAAGGVGLAAIQVARSIGAHVFATAGSELKRDYLRSIGIEHVFDSRSTSFVDDTLRATSGEGIDVVLNSLIGPAIPAGLSLLRSGGRFIEIGKRDIQENVSLGLRCFQNNLIFASLDLDRMLAVSPALAKGMLQSLVQQFASQQYQSLPRRSFPVSQASDAFRHVAKAKQIGKVVLDMLDPLLPTLQKEGPSTESIQFKPDGTYLVTGGLTGFGLATARWLVDRGARHLALVSRRGRCTLESTSEIEQLESIADSVKSFAADVSVETELSTVLETIRKEMPPLKGVVHASMVLDDDFALRLTPDRVEKVLAPKAWGAWNLHRLTCRESLDHFILFSSATTHFGNPSQASYVAACAFLDHLAQHRRSTGQPAISVAWGAIADVGYLSRNNQVLKHIQDRLGFRPILASRLLKYLDQLLQSDSVQASPVAIDWERLSALNLPVTSTPLFQLLTEQLAPKSVIPINAPGSIRNRLVSVDADTRSSVMREFLREGIANVLGTTADHVESDRSLLEMGLDSLMAVEFQLLLSKEMELEISPMVLLGGPSLEELAEYLLTNFDQRRSTAKPESEVPSQSSGVITTGVPT